MPLLNPALFISPRVLDLINVESSVGPSCNCPARENYMNEELDERTGTSRGLPATRGDLNWIGWKGAETGACCCYCEPNDICGTT